MSPAGNADLPVFDFYGDGGSGRDAEHAAFRDEGQLARWQDYKTANRPLSPWPTP